MVTGDSAVVGKYADPQTFEIMFMYCSRCQKLAKEILSFA